MHIEDLHLPLTDLPAVEVLHLPIIRSGSQVRNTFLKDFASPILRDLEIGSSGCFWIKQHSRESYDEHYQKPRSGRAPHLAFREQMVPTKCYLPRLKSLTLRGFVFDNASLHDLLMLHRESLRSVHIIDCWSVDTYDAFCALAMHTFKPALTLSGIEIYGLRFLHPNLVPGNGLAFPMPAQGQWHLPLPIPTTADLRAAGEIDDFSEEYDERMRERRRLDYEYTERRDRLHELPRYNQRNWPRGRSELEAAFLPRRVPGVKRRGNMVVRKAKAAGTQEVVEGWHSL